MICILHFFVVVKGSLKQFFSLSLIMFILSKPYILPPVRIHKSVTLTVLMFGRYNYSLKFGICDPKPFDVSKQYIHGMDPESFEV